MSLTEVPGAMTRSRARDKAAARSLEELWRVIADLLDEFSPQECQNFFRHAGYGLNQS